MFEKLPLFKRLYRKGYKKGQENAYICSRWNLEHAIENSPVVVAPTMQMADGICKQFGLSRTKSARAPGPHLRGYGPGTVFIIYEGAGPYWDTGVKAELEQMLASRRYIVLRVPELMPVRR